MGLVRTLMNSGFSSSQESTLKDLMSVMEGEAKYIRPHPHSAEDVEPPKDPTPTEVELAR